MTRNGADHDFEAGIRQMVDGYNAAPQADLLGLSPNQLARLLHGDWRSIGAVRLAGTLPAERVDRAWAYRAAAVARRRGGHTCSPAARATGSSSSSWTRAC
ncbi:MAG: hypothetical protein AB7R55_11725 [Gemmatimonadales bacterium]